MPGYPEFSLVGSHCLLLPGTGGTRLEREKSSEVGGRRGGGQRKQGQEGVRLPRCSLISSPAELQLDCISCNFKVVFLSNCKQ